MFILTILIGAMFPGPDEIVISRPVPKLLIGRDFRNTVRKRFKIHFGAVSRDNPAPNAIKTLDTLRTVLRELSKQLEIGIVLDRRIDPTQRVEIDVEDKTLIETLQLIAQSCSAEAVVINDYIYVAPKGTAKTLNAVSKKRSMDMRVFVRKLPRRQRGKYTDRKTLHWNDLDEPRQIVLKIAEKFHLKVEEASAKLIPHDLWAGSTIPNARLVDQLSFILTQYHLTFRWGPRGQSITIEPIGKAR